MRLLSRTWFRISQRLGIGPSSGLEYWERRARLLGPEAVVNTAPGGDAITAVQRDKVLPVFVRQLRGFERLIVDFGCGPGRFSGTLAELAGCEVLGTDPIATLVEAAPASDRVRYATLRNGRVPVSDGDADAVFICEVLGAILSEDELLSTASEIDRILAPGGFVVLAESDLGTTVAGHWTDRSASAYADAFGFLELIVEDHYEDDGHRIVVMSGRRRAATAG